MPKLRDSEKATQWTVDRQMRFRQVCASDESVKHVQCSDSTGAVAVLLQRRATGRFRKR